MAITHLYGETQQPWARDQIGGYGLAIEALAGICGCAPAEAMWVVMTDDVSEPPLPNGWCNITDGGQFADKLYHNGQLVADISVSSRGFWVARAYLTDGRRYYSEGEDNTFVPWVQIS